MDYNLYVQNSMEKNYPIILWSPVQNSNCRESFTSIEDLKKMHPEFNRRSQSFKNYFSYLFKNKELKNYWLVKNSIASHKGAELPSTLKNLINQSVDYIGAYPEAVE
ncbi:MAG: hypothetical protein HXY50_03885 [Ignavibacteriaceae bacterium]|nr:hypothetical protein [Ignavibacteriaceae bacterium]